MRDLSNLLETESTVEEKIRESLSFHLHSRLPKEVLKNNPFLIEISKKRFIDCLHIKEQPPKSILTSFCFQEEKPDYDEAAKACEFYGGLAYKATIENKRNPFNLKDYEQSLSMMYQAMDGLNPVYGEMALHSGEILSVYRQVIDKIEKRHKSNVITFH